MAPQWNVFEKMVPSFETMFEKKNGVSRKRLKIVLLYQKWSCFGSTVEQFFQKKKVKNGSTISKEELF